MVCVPLMNKVLRNPVYFGCLFLKSGDLKRGDLKKGGSYYLSHWIFKIYKQSFFICPGLENKVQF